MPLGENLFSKLSSDSAVTALVGAGVACRIYPGIAPHAVTAPYVVWAVVSTSPDTTLDGPSESGVSLVQLSCVAANYTGVRNLAAAIVAAIDSVPLAGGEVCLSCREQDGYSETTEQFLRIVEADFFTADAAPAQT